MKLNNIIQQRAAREKCIAGTLQKIKKFHKKKEENFFVFAHRILKKCSSKFLQENKADKIYSYTLFLYKNFLKNLNNELSVNIHQNKFIQTENQQNSLFVEILLSNRPFVVDSLRNHFREQCNYILTYLNHPILFIKKKKNGITILPEEQEKIHKYNYVSLLVIAPDTSEKTKIKLQQEISDVLGRLVAATNDHSKMKQTLLSLKNTKSIFIKDDKRQKERTKLYKWIATDNMILLGVNSISEKKLSKKNLDWKDFDNNLGVFSYLQKVNNLDFVKEIQQYLPSFYTNSLSISFAESQYNSKIHVTDKLIYIFSKIVDENSGQITFFCVAGVFTIASSLQDIMKIPLVGLKLGKIIDEMNITKNSHDFKHLRDIFNSFPKYECFRMEKEEIRIFADKSLYIWELDQVETSLYQAPTSHYARIVIFIPIENFDNRDFDKVILLLKKNIQNKIGKCYWFFCGNSVQCHFIYFGCEEKNITGDILSKIETEIWQLLSQWQKALETAIKKNFPKKNVANYKLRYLKAFDKFYQSRHNIQQVLQDIENFESIITNQQDYIDIICENEQSSLVVLYSSKTYHLNEILPKIQNLALNVLQEISYQIVIQNTKYQKHTYIVSHTKIKPTEREVFKYNIQTALLAIFQGKLANEKINGLITYANFYYKEVNLFTALKKYMYQLGCNVESHLFDDILLENPKITKSLLAYFVEKFSPNNKEQNSKITLATKEVEIQIAKLKTLTEDNIFRNLYNFLQAMLRTNYYNIQGKEALAFKIYCNNVRMMQNPKPIYEIFVYGIDLSGVHLRGGKIARGGLRFSDRKDDFRTEVLGLMSAQMLKNAVIVPEGSKGGFIIDEPFSTREEMLKVVEKHYRRFIQSLISLTENFIKGKSQIPKGIVRYDTEDPYLVVAADKGTAHLSDVANEISLKQGFWLGDAFASGGSVGYNHKEVGITARGAWECVKIHFLELGIDIQKEHFSVVGIGDMGGDVFGNGMLLSKKIKLHGAFNHLHIFVDPNPPSDDSAWKERKKLFETSGSNWQDYNKELISKGGGIFERNAKSINLTLEIKIFLKTNKTSVSGEELIRMLLKAPVDLLWNGGIGTYVKSKQQTHIDVGDPSNNSVRINASELRASVIGEGGNLGFTQAARLEFALGGGKINADSIDNSAGVDMSDHEVNIKIMISRLIEKQKVKKGAARVKILADLTNEVTRACLKNNQDQSYILSMSQLDSQENLGDYLDIINFLIEQKIINPEKEELLEESILQEYAKGLPRPYLCSLLSYTKMFYFRNILNTNLPDESFCEKYFLDYFPPSMLKKFQLLKYKHQLYREIVTTCIINQQINQFGILFLQLLKQWSDRNYDLILKTYIIVDNIFDGKKIRAAIFKFYGGKNINQVYGYLLQLEKFLREISLWLLLNLPAKKIDFDMITDYQRKLNQFYPELLLQDNINQQNLLTLLEIQKSTENPLEKIYLMDEQKLTKKSAEEIFEQVYKLLGLSISTRLTKMKIDSSYGKQHIGLLLQNINSLKWKIYQKIFKNTKKFLENPQIFFKFSKNSLLEKIVQSEDFLTKNKNATLHLAAVLTQELEELVAKK